MLGGNHSFCGVDGSESLSTNLRRHRSQKRWKPDTHPRGGRMSHARGHESLFVSITRNMYARVASCDQCGNTTTLQLTSVHIEPQSIDQICCAFPVPTKLRWEEGGAGGGASSICDGIAVIATEPSLAECALANVRMGAQMPLADHNNRSGGPSRRHPRHNN